MVSKWRGLRGLRDARAGEVPPGQKLGERHRAVHLAGFAPTGLVRASERVCNNRVQKSSHYFYTTKAALYRETALLLQ